VHTSDFPIINLTVDVVCLTIREGQLQVLLVRRGKAPYRGRLALPGGFVEINEDLDVAARRELREETSIVAPRHMEQLGTYGAPKRDPRGRTVTVVWLAIAPDLPEAIGGSDASSASWTPVTEVFDHPRRMAFDHAQIIRDGVERIRGKLEYSPLAADFCGDEFTVADLRRVYETIWDVHLDPGNFQRKVTKTKDFLESVGRKRPSPGTGRPADLFRKSTGTKIHPPLDRNSLSTRALSRN
jgi:8-oxo-dGTP diphosphatase